MSPSSHEEEPLLSAFLDGELEEPRRTEVESHVSACFECRAELEALRKIKFALAGAPRKSLPADWRVPGTQRPLARPTARIPSKTVLRLLVPVGVAAAILIVAGFWVLQIRKSARTMLASTAPEAVSAPPDQPPDETP